MKSRIRAPRTRSDLPLRARVCLPRESGRLRMERFVGERYAAAYRARIHRFLPELLGLYSGRGDIVGVIGARRARPLGRLFVESYLDEPIEAALGRASDTAVPRGSVAEVGNLAATVPGGNRMLVTTFAAYLDAAGIEWAVFAATRSLRNGFERLGVELFDLGAADGERLGQGLRDWGAYYDTDPRVTAVRVPDVCRCGALQPRLRLQLEPAWSEARCEGLRNATRASA